MNTVNWGDMNVSESAPVIAPGFYLSEVVDYEKTVAKTGTQQIKVKHRILEPGEAEGAPLFDFLALSEAAMWRVGAFVQACGLDLKSLPNMELGSEQFWRVVQLTKGRRVYLDVAQETNPKSGKPVNKVKGFTLVEDQEPLEYVDNVPSFIKNKHEADAKKAGLI